MGRESSEEERSHPILVLIVSNDETRRRRWREMLKAPDFQVLAENAPGETTPDIVLADMPPSLWAELPTLESRLWTESWERQRVRGEIGVVALAPNRSGDVALPAEYAQRELRMACRLLAQIIALRRQRRKGAQTRRVLRRLAATDPLTGLANLRAWREELAQRLSETAGGAALCLALFDLDGFKEVNSLLGYRRGDALLQRLSQKLAEHVRPNDFIARLGGDEFGLLLSGVDTAHLHRMIEGVRAVLVEPPQGAAPAVTTSAGFAAVAPDGKTSRQEGELFDLADAALRWAKRCGANQTRNAADMPPRDAPPAHNE